MDHIVRSDAIYLRTLTGDACSWLGDSAASEKLDELASRVDELASRWAALLSGSLDGERRLLLDEGTFDCAASIVIVQALQHATAHREQIRLNLRRLGVAPPDVQPWEYALDVGRGHFCSRDTPTSED